MDYPLGLDPVEYWSLIAAAAVTACAGFVAAFVYLRRARLIEDTPTSRVRSAALGYCELEGEAATMAGEPILAPLTLTPCAWFRYSVEQREHGSGGQGARWRMLRRGTSDGLFLLRDDTGACVIDPEGAVVTPSASHVWYGDTPTPLPGVPPGRLRGGRYRYREERIQDGDFLYAIGELKSSGGADGPGRAEAVRALLAAWKRDQGRLLARFDANRDGLVDAAEWERARAAAEHETATELRRQLAEPAVLLMSRPNAAGRPYLLSSLPPRRLARRCKLIAATSFAVFLLTGVLLWWLLNNRPV